MTRRASLMLRGLSTRLIEAAARALEPRAHVVVHGWPANEGNAVEVVRALAARYQGQIYWLIDDPENWLVEAPARVRIVRKSSIIGVTKYITAEAVFFTHGLFGGVQPSRHRVFVNLWHGDGPKTNRDAQLSRRPLFPSTYVVGGTELFSQPKVEDFRLARESLILSGNPRIDQFWQPPGDVFRRRVGLQDDEPYVVWMPTYRTRRHVGGGDSGARDVVGEVGDFISAAEGLFAALAARGIVVLLRRHPADAEEQTVGWAAELTNELLGQTRTTLYNVLGGAAGLVTDYSSVWTDYLVLDRPIAFYIPDSHAYEQGRGLHPPDVLEWLPGIDLLSPGGPEAFADDILLDPARSSGLRKAAADRIGLVRTRSAADRLLDELEARNAFAVSGRLRADGERLPALGVFRRTAEARGGVVDR